MDYFGVNNINILKSLSFKGICLDHSPYTFQCKAKKCQTLSKNGVYINKNKEIGKEKNLTVILA